MKYIIAIDGPAGAGKSTVAKALAQKLGFFYLDTGALYRTLTYKALQKGLDLENEKTLAALAHATKIDLQDKVDGLHVFMDDQEVTDQIRTPEVTRSTFYIARSPEVRQAILPLQRKFGERANLVVEGRDTTTVVFPNATLKIYLDANLGTRAKRRGKDLTKAGVEQSITKIAEEVAERDNHDRSRSVAPLRQAEDAFYLDTTNLSITEVVERLASLFYSSVPSFVRETVDSSSSAVRPCCKDPGELPE
ncbi:MAG: (d)CMP kinase [Candidatus Ratteibacteria bacterium]|jgi:cytidylate kinase